MTARALIVVDVQNDFCEGGSLAVAGGAEVARRVAEHVGAHREEYAGIVATRDHHVDPGPHFADTPPGPDYVDTWPAHCVVGTDGAELHPAFAGTPVDAVFDKGANAAAYSGFEGTTVEGDALTTWLRERGVTEVDVVGIATDFCVRATALDAATNGFATTVLLDLTAGVAEDTTRRACEQLATAGVRLVKSITDEADGQYSHP